MNVPKLIAACLAMTLSLAAGCSKDEDTNYYAGYSSPGKFRPKGVAWEKSYNFSDTSISKSCYSKDDPTTPATPVPAGPIMPESAGRCGAVHVSWYSSTTLSEGYPIEGIAANDKHLLPNPANFTIQITRSVDLSWKITVALGGVKYHNNTRDIELIKYTSSLETDPFYDPTWSDRDNDDEEKSSDVPLKLVFVRFTNNIILYTDPNLDVCDPAHPERVPCSKTVTIYQTGPLPDPLKDPVYVDIDKPIIAPNTESDPHDYTFTLTYNLPTSGDYMIVQDHGL